MKDDSHVRELKKIQTDYMITVYWPFLLKSEIFSLPKYGAINFHPALLPINRGWYPHVHSIIDGSPSGVTLHFIDEGADTGPILAQKQVAVEVIDTAKTLHEKLQVEIITLFKEIWPKIINGKIIPTLQDNSKAIYHKKSEIDQLDHIDLEKDYKAKELINLLRARTFGEKGFAYFLVDGKKVYLNLKLSYQNSF